MSGSGERFYLMEMRNRPVMYGDIGSIIKISGVVLTGGGGSAVILLPGAKQAVEESNRRRITRCKEGHSPLNYCAKCDPDAHWYELTMEELSDFILRSDDPEVLVGPAKVFHRKLRYEISGSVQQKIWTADGFKCMYCSAKMGDRLMTIDHFMPLEMGGKNDSTNYLSACKPCNKDKGSQDPFVWCAERGLDPNKFVDYLGKRVIK